ncbi:unnamed protein product, partial [Allacma fusca]
CNIYLIFIIRQWNF